MTRRVLLQEIVGKVDADGNVRLDPSFRQIMDDLLNGDRDYSVNTMISGTNSIINGTANLAGVVINGENLLARIEASEANAETARTTAASAAGMSIGVNTSSVAATRAGAGLVDTDTLQITINGGTANYTVAYTKLSGGAITASGDTTRTNTDPFNVTFSATVADGETLTAQYKIEVTDSSGSPLSDSVTVAVTLSDSGAFEQGLV